MIAAKQAGQEVTEVPHAKMAPVIDLMEALKKSIAEKQPAAANSGRKPPVRAIQAAESPAPAKRAKKSAG
jgi:non-homologous end joining protein Ku